MFYYYYYGKNVSLNLTHYITAECKSDKCDRRVFLLLVSVSVYVWLLLVVMNDTKKNY